MVPSLDCRVISDSPEPADPRRAFPSRKEEWEGGADTQAKKVKTYGNNLRTALVSIRGHERFPRQ
jgi:hypothetical protein